MSHPSLSGPVRKPASGAPKQLVVLLHGWGADGPNLIDLADAFAPVLPNAQFIAPNAPFPCEANPYGYQWFSLIDRQPQHMLDGVKKATDILNQFLDEQLKALSLDNSKLVLIGFSQGTMTALHLAVRRSPQIAAVVGFSGALLSPEILPGEITSRPPICLVHGEMDDVVPFGALAHATQTLKTQNVPVESHARPYVGHSIDMDGIKFASDFLRKNVTS